MTGNPSAGLRGRQPVKPPSERFAINFLPSYLRSALPAVTYPVDVSAGITEWRMLGNGPDPELKVNGGQPVGDCTFAAREHLRMAKAAAGGTTETWETSDQLVTEYLAYDHGVDRGANIADLLMHWFLTGKIRAFAPVDHTDPVACDMVMAAFHGLYVGLDLPDSANAQFNGGEAWSLEGGERPDPTDGHCIVKVGSDGKQFDTWVTWGALQRSSCEWTAACIQEAWAVVTTEDQAAKIDMPTLVAHILAARQASTAVSGTVGAEQNDGATAFALGWQMAQLYGPLSELTRIGPTDHLPSIAEYDTDAQVSLAYDQLDSRLNEMGLTDLSPVARPAGSEANDRVDREALRCLHVRILNTLACRDGRQAASYEVGRSLSDACWLADPDHRLPPQVKRATVFFEQFDRDHLAALQGGLGQMSALAPYAAPVASRSVQNWSDWIEANATVLTRHWDISEAKVGVALRNQSASWYRLLSTESITDQQPPMGAWLHASESILRSTRVMAVSLIRRFWLLAILAAAATAGLLYVALNDAHGPSRVWATLVTAAGSVVASGAGLRAGAKRLAGGLEQKVWQAATLDAQAWAVTWLPTLRQGPLQRWRLRRSGVALPTSAIHLERIRAVHQAKPPID